VTQLAWWETGTRLDFDAPLCPTCGLRQRAVVDYGNDVAYVCCNVFRCAEGEKAQGKWAPPETTSRRGEYEGSLDGIRPAQGLGMGARRPRPQR
jgi:hypothetical protein